MKILAVNGSHRGEAGSTQWLLNKIADGAREKGAEFETVVLTKQKIKPCIGCEICHTDKYNFKCIYDKEDDVRNIFEKMKTADIVIYATPVYVFSMSGIMKTFIDRFNSTAGVSEICLSNSGLFFHTIDKNICSKPFVILTCCGNIEQETIKNVISYFKTFSKFLDAPIVGTLARKSIGVMEEERKNKPPKAVVTAVINAYIEAGRELAVQGRITTRTEKQANQQVLGVPYLDLLLNFTYFKKMAIQKRKPPTSSC
jgi:multimeric flavodoxin WrbA